MFFVQITDRDGTRFQDHGSIELSNLDKNITHEWHHSLEKQRSGAGAFQVYFGQLLAHAPESEIGHF
jgi:hypothetical protein